MPILLVRPALRFAVPAMRLQLLEQGGVEGPCVASGDIFFDVSGFSHADDGVAHGGIRQNEAQAHLRQAHARREDLLQLFDAFERAFALVFVEDAMASLIGEAHVFAIKTIFPRLGLVRSTSDVLKALD